MKTQVVINISYWNEKIEVEQVKNVCSDLVNIDKSMEFIHKDLHQYILKNKGDAFQFKIYESDNHAIIIIELFHSIEEFATKINLDYLNKYFENFSYLDDNLDIRDESMYDHYISIRLDEDNKTHLNKLMNHDIEMKTQKVYSVFERGAGDIAEIIVFGIVGNASYDALKAVIKSWFTEFQYTGNSISKDELDPIIDYLYEQFGVTPASIQPKEFFNLGDDIFIIFLTRNEEIKVEWNRKSGVKSVIRNCIK